MKLKQSVYEAFGSIHYQYARKHLRNSDRVHKFE